MSRPTPHDSDDSDDFNDPDDLDNRHTWDLTRVFESPADWDRARDELLDDLDALGSLADPPVDEPGHLRDLVDAVADCFRRRQRLDLYAELAANVNTDDPTASDRQRRFRELDGEFETAVTGVLRALAATDDGVLDAAAADLNGRGRYLANLRERAARVLPPAVEETVAAFEEARTSPDRVLVAATTEDFEPPTVERPDGEPVTVTMGCYRREVSHPDRDYRRRVHEAFHDELSRLAGTTATAYAEKLGAASALASVRGYDSVRELAFRGRTYPENGLRATFPPAAHDAMLAAVRENLGPRNRTRRIRAERLGVDTLKPWDLSAPLGGRREPVDLSYETAREHVVAALAPLGADYQDRIRAFLDDRRVDVHERDGKRDDIVAYCPSSADDGAFVLLNWDGTPRSMFYLCHELGHAMHAAHHREGPATYATCPRPVEEVPSFVHELLLIDHCLDAGGPLSESARDRVLVGVGNNFYGSATWSAFRHRLACVVGDGRDLDADRIQETYLDCREAYDPAVDWSGEPRSWLRAVSPRDPYHSYQYVLGVTGALAVHDRLTAGELPPGEYRDFLRATGREPSVALFDRLGLDVTRAEPYERAAAAFDDRLDAFG